MSDVVINAEALSKEYQLGLIGGGTLREDLDRWWSSVRGSDDAREGARASTHHWALRDVSFDVKRGDIVGVIGRNGAGKSTLLKIMSRITAPTSGRLRIKGHVGSLLEVGTGFHPELTGRENIFLNGAILGMRRSRIEERFEEIVEFSELGTFIDTPVKRYSSGMYVRLAFAVAAHLESDILLVDEVLAVGDAAFQEKCLGKIGDVATGGRTVLFVSHNTAAVARLCTAGVLLEGGRLRLASDIRSVLGAYLFEGEEAGECLWADGDMPGDDELRLRRVTVRQAGLARSVLNIEDPIDIEIETIALRELREATIGVIIRDASGVPIVHSTSTFGVDNPERRPGPQVLRCRVPGGLLNRGRYAVAVVADVPNVKFYVPPTEVLSFSVDPTRMRESRHAASAWSGVLGPAAVSWSVEELDEPVHPRG
jgi:lipopolysaccharide transport system ATP-binding protein